MTGRCCPMSHQNLKCCPCGVAACMDTCDVPEPRSRWPGARMLAAVSGLQFARHPRTLPAQQYCCAALCRRQMLCCQVTPPAAPDDVQVVHPPAKSSAVLQAGAVRPGNLPAGWSPATTFQTLCPSPKPPAALRMLQAGAVMPVPVLSVPTRNNFSQADYCAALCCRQGR